jgi:hypothetical protein
VRHRVAFAVAFMLMTAGRAGASPAASSDELLQLWNRDYGADAYESGPGAEMDLAPTFELDAVSRVPESWSPSSSMTPHLDRLLKTHTPFPGQGTASPGIGAGESFKGGSGPSIDTRRNRDRDRNCRPPCRHWPRHDVCRSPCRHRPRCNDTPPKPPPPPDCPPPPPPVPEPTSMLLFGAAAATAAGIKAKRRKKRER